MRGLLALVSVLVASILGCAEQPGNRAPSAEPLPSESGGAAPVEQGATPTEPRMSSATGEVPRELFDEVLADLEERTGGGLGEVEILRAEAVVWQDGALGCPEPGMMYMQAITSGYWLVLEHGGVQYDYRLSEGGAIRLCEEDAPPAAATPLS